MVRLSKYLLIVASTMTSTLPETSLANIIGYTSQTVPMCPQGYHNVLWRNTNRRWAMLGRQNRSGMHTG